MRDNIIPINGNPPEDEPPVVLLEGPYIKAFIGIAIDGRAEPRACYSLPRLKKIIKRIKMLDDEGAQNTVIGLVGDMTAAHGAKAPVFIDDSDAEPMALDDKPLVATPRIVRPGGGRRPKRR